MVTQLKTKMTNATKDNKPPTLDEVISEIDKVATSYENLASRKEEIKQHFKDKIGIIKSMQASVNTEISVLNKRIEDYNHQLLALPTTTNDAETIRTRTKSLKKAVDYVNQQINLWNSFYQLEAEITGQLSNVQAQIDNFIGMIGSSAIVFREGLNLLQLQKDINSALSLFTIDLPTIQRLTQDMERSWDSLDYLIQNLISITPSINSTMAEVQ